VLGCWRKQSGSGSMSACACGGDQWLWLVW
jgi:hypothetical protein